MNGFQQSFGVFTHQLFFNLLRISGRKSTSICSISRARSGLPAARRSASCQSNVAFWLTLISGDSAVMVYVPPMCSRLVAQQQAVQLLFVDRFRQIIVHTLHQTVSPFAPAIACAVTAITGVCC